MADPVRLLNVDRAVKVMEEHDLDVLVASSMVNVYYLTGWSSEVAWAFADITLAFICRDDPTRPTLVGEAPDIEMNWRKGPFDGVILRLYGGHGASAIGPDQLSALSAGLKEQGLVSGRIGFDNLDLGMAFSTEAAGRWEPVGAADIFRQIRLIKTRREQQLISMAARRTAIALEVAIEALATAPMLRQAQRVFESTCASIDAVPLCLSRMALRPGDGYLDIDVALRPGDTIGLDATAGVGHYLGDLGRTVVMGAPTRAQSEAYDAIRTGWSESLPAIGPGMSSKQVTDIVLDQVRRAGAPGFVSGGVHSVGLEHTDHPHRWGASNHFDLEPGMVISVDMPFHEEPQCQFHLEELLLIGEHGAGMLSDGDNRLYVIEDEAVSRYA